MGFDQQEDGATGEDTGGLGGVKILQNLSKAEAPGLGTMREYQEWEDEDHVGKASGVRAAPKMPDMKLRLPKHASGDNEERATSPGQPLFKQLRVQTYSNKSLQRLGQLRVRPPTQQQNCLSNGALNGSQLQSLEASQPTSGARGPAAQRLRPKGAPPSPWSVTSCGRSGTGQQVTIGSHVSAAEVRLPVSPYQQERQVIQAHDNNQIEGTGRNRPTKR